MQSQNLEILAEITSLSNKSREQKLYIRILTPEERKHYALKTLGIFWGLAFCSIFLPGVHFVLVPAFFLLGPYFAWNRYKVTEHLIASEFQCPECEKTVIIKEQARHFPLELVCSSCKYVLKVNV